MKDEKVALSHAPGTGIEDLVHAAALGYAGDGVHYGGDQGSGGRHVAAVVAGVRRHLGGRGSKSELPPPPPMMRYMICQGLIRTEKILKSINILLFFVLFLVNFRSIFIIF